MKAKIIALWVGWQYDIEVTAETIIWIDNFNDLYDEKYNNSIRILCVIEPLGIMFQSIDIILSHVHRFHYIVTYFDELLAFKNSILLMPFLNTWVMPYTHTDNKEFKISFVCGDKQMVHGHRLRQKIWELQKNISIPKDFIMSGHSKILSNIDNNKILGKNIQDKQILFDNNMFHLCIENVKMNNLVTEKIMDCFITKTIPIYWGCPNIQKWFNIKGIIFLNTNNPYEIIELINKLTSADYYSHVEYIDENYTKALEYISNPQNIPFVLKQNNLIL